MTVIHALGYWPTLFIALVIAALLAIPVGIWGAKGIEMENERERDADKS
jgi:hypothetical protein